MASSLHTEHYSSSRPAVCAVWQKQIRFALLASIPDNELSVKYEVSRPHLLLKYRHQDIIGALHTMLKGISAEKGHLGALSMDLNPLACTGKHPQGYYCPQKTASCK